MATTLGTVELARRVVNILDTLQSGFLSLGGSGSTVDAILSWLKREDLTRSEVMELLGHLRTSGHLGAFLNLVSHRDLRAYLREKEVPWPFVLQNWDPSINDTGSFFAGFLVGAAESVGDVVRMVVVIGGAPFSPELAKERDQFWEAVRFMVSDEFFALARQFAASPGQYAAAAFDQLRAQVEERLWNLEFFEAGRLLGMITAALLTIVGGLKKLIKDLPAILRGISRIARELVELTHEQIRGLGVSIDKIRQFALSGAQQLVTDTGHILVASPADDAIVVLDKTATPLGKVTRATAIRQPASQAVKAFGVVRGFLNLSGASRSWLAAKGLLRLARNVLKPAVDHVDDIVDAINRFHNATGFDRVAKVCLRSLSNNSEWALKARQGATFVMRYATGKLSHIDPRLVIFEARALEGGSALKKGVQRVRSVFIRFSDIVVYEGGVQLRIELKSVANLGEEAVKRAVKQLSRDIIANIDHLDDLEKRVRWVFDSDALRISRATVYHELKAAVLAESKFQHPRIAAALDEALKRVITFWPP